ncbi:DUF885 domain-containing protein [Ferrimonas sediminicola]|uniref:DUF885 domain-containing protein n=1 Tax=Ferrimonas sediminicola TaxID=2569538 RepID=A0A4U1BCK8_9GAMM|nr:DUF885 domain-containing protein [Ferrimonas sediminicola]TKB48235.1 DUF885 domain-containing protein [Ferrimonas sediminicola]
MRVAKLAVTLALALGTVACGPAQAPKEPMADAAQAQVSMEQRYLDLVGRYFDDLLALDPISATFAGRSQYNHLFGNELTEEYLKARHDLNSKMLADLDKIDAAQLSEQNRVGYEVIRYDVQTALKAETYPSRWLPLNQFYSKVFTLVQLGSGESAQPFDTEQDFDNFIGRMQGFAQWVDSAIERMDQGIESKVVLPRVLVERMIPQIQAQLVQSPDDSIFAQPLQNLPEALGDDQRAALKARYQDAIMTVLMPALTKLEGYLTQIYLPASRGSHGWWGLPNGKEWYQFLANENTTTQMPVAQIHELGLQEVARILEEMDRVRQQVGFEGDLSAFFEHLGSDPEFFFTTKQDLVDGYMGLKSRIDAVLPGYFDVSPKADYVVKPVEPFRERSAAGASYEAPSPDGVRPGVFYINTFNLKAQPKWGMTTLSLHEAAPGHHFQIAIKQELEGVPEFQRFGGYTAFEEGWALYAEYLGIEMGLFSDPYQYFGKLSDEMLRAMRLVVDTGLHAKGWSREQAIQYMLDNSPLAKTDVIAEVERYMAIPGQALSYKVGQLKILELRAYAEKELGDRFDLKAFHNQVLTSGSLPMAVLERKIQLWVASLRA